MVAEKLRSCWKAICASRYPAAENIFSYKKDIIHKMGQVCLETQIALAIQFLSIADQKVGDY